MSTTQRSQVKNKKVNKELEYQALLYIATLVLAALAILTQEKDPVIWAFLTTAIGFAMGRASK